MQAPLPQDESARLDALHQYAILDTLPEEAFDDLARLAATLCQTPIALVSLIDECRQWFKARIGLDVPETHRDLAFCAHAILQPDDLLIVPDTQLDPRFATNSLVTDAPHIRFYAGMPLITPAGYALGTLCVIDRVPRTLNTEQQQALQALARQVVNQLEMRRNLSELAQSVLQQHQAEAALQENRERLKLALQAAKAGSWELKLATGELIASHQCKANFGLAAHEEITYQRFMQLIHPDDRSMMQAKMQAAIDQHAVYEAEYRTIWSDQSTHWILARGQAFYDDSGISDRMVGVTLDITERKHAEEELLNLNRALESAVEGIAQVNAQGRYMKVNPAYAQMLGYSPLELVGIEWQSTVYSTDQEKMNVAYQSMLNTDKAEVELRGLRKDGTVFDQLVVMVKAYDQQQQLVGHYCFAKDISERREIERMKDRFVAVVSHELRTPLTSISAALDLLAEGVLQAQPEEAQRMLMIAANNTDRLVRLINDILDIERIESGKVIMAKQVCDAQDLIIQAVEAVQEIADREGIVLVAEPLSVRLWADPDRIIQVITNLLSNAIKFSVSGQTVEVSTQWLDPSIAVDRVPDIVTALPSSPLLLVQVTDQGRGIPADKLDSIFGRFQQVDASDSRQKGGTGLGLAICRSIVQQHDGQIGVTSQLGEGSSFYFTLPVSAAEMEVVPLDINLDERSAVSVPYVLICDDDASVRTVVAAMLERQGYQVQMVASGQQAIIAAANQQPDVILLNLMMPEMDGWETLAALKQQPATVDIPVIILSGLLPDARITYPEIDDWIVKPPNAKLLSTSLKRSIARHHTVKVLIVEDDLDLAQLLTALFLQHQIEAVYARTGFEAIQLSQQIMPDLLVLDLGLSHSDGFAVVDWLRQHQQLHCVPLVVYTAYDLSESDRKRLKLGQTLFLTKGRISLPEFEQQVIALLDRIVRNRGKEPIHDNQANLDY